MTEALARLRAPWVPILLGSYAALLALAPNPTWLTLGTAPAFFVCLAWWTLAGAPDRWITIFLCAAVVLPPLPIALGDSGPHPSLAVAGLGLAAGVLHLRAWRAPAGAPSR